jgi:hypothetical protein
MKLLAESGRDLIEILKVRFWLAPFFGAGGKVVIKTSWYADYPYAQVRVRQLPPTLGFLPAEAIVTGWVIFLQLDQRVLMRQESHFKLYSHLKWLETDVLGLFSLNVVSFSRNLVLRGSLFSLNSVSNPRMLSV